MKARVFLALVLASGCASAPPPQSSSAAPAPGGASRAPYDSPPVATDTVTIALDLDAARRILTLLSAPAFNADGTRALESLPAVQTAIRDSKRPPEAFEHDLAAAFEDTPTSVVSALQNKGFEGVVFTGQEPTWSGAFSRLSLALGRS